MENFTELRITIIQNMYIKSANLMIKTPLGNRNIFFSEFSCAPVRTCVYGRYAVSLNIIHLHYYSALISLHVIGKVVLKNIPH